MNKKNRWAISQKKKKTHKKKKKTLSPQRLGSGWSIVSVLFGGCSGNTSCADRVLLFRVFSQYAMRIPVRSPPPPPPGPLPPEPPPPSFPMPRCFSFKLPADPPACPPPPAGPDAASPPSCVSTPGPPNAGVRVKASIPGPGCCQKGWWLFL